MTSHFCAVIVRNLKWVVLAISIQIVCNVLFYFQSFEHERGRIEAQAPVNRNPCANNNNNHHNHNNIDNMELYAGNRSANANPVVVHRVVVSISATPHEIPHKVNDSINWILTQQTYIVDVFYLHVPYMQLRDDNKLYPRTSALRRFFPQTKVYIHRMFTDCGPISRYLGILSLETDPQTLIISFDVDLDKSKREPHFIHRLVKYANYRADVWWVRQGHSKVYSETKGKILSSVWKRYPTIVDTPKTATGNHHRPDSEDRYIYSRREIFRAVSGIAYHRWMLDDLWLNATDYYEGCFWDDDHWMSFHLERKRILIYNIIDAAEHKRQQQQKVLQEQEQQKIGQLAQMQMQNNTNTNQTITQLQLQTHENTTKSGRRLGRRRLLGSLTKINQRLESAHKCPEAIFKAHPSIWPNARVA